MPKSTKFKPGQSGNPGGRPKGAKDKRTEFREMFQSRSEEIINKAIELALSGDSSCLKMCIDRIVSPYRAKDSAVSIANLEGSLTNKGDTVITAMGKGEISPGDAASMLAAIASQARIAEFETLEQRIVELESRTAQKS